VAMQYIPLQIVVLRPPAPPAIPAQYPKVLCGRAARDIRRKQEFRGDGAGATPLGYGKQRFASANFS